MAFYQVSILSHASTRASVIVHLDGETYTDEAIASAVRAAVGVYGESHKEWDAPVRSPIQITDVLRTHPSTEPPIGAASPLTQPDSSDPDNQSQYRMVIVYDTDGDYFIGCTDNTEGPTIKLKGAVTLKLYSLRDAIWPLATTGPNPNVDYGMPADVDIKSRSRVIHVSPFASDAWKAYWAKRVVSQLTSPEPAAAVKPVHVINDPAYDLMLLSTDSLGMILGFVKGHNGHVVTLHYAIPVDTTVSANESWNVVTVGPTKGVNYPSPTTVEVPHCDVKFTATAEARDAWRRYWTYQRLAAKA